MQSTIWRKFSHFNNFIFQIREIIFNNLSIIIGNVYIFDLLEVAIKTFNESN